MSGSPQLADGRWQWWAARLSSVLVSVVVAACGGGDGQTTSFHADFESGSIGEVAPLPGRVPSWELKLRDDNGDPRLPGAFRTWWYLRAEGLPAHAPVRLEFTRLGWHHDYVPVYSYDNVTWRHFDASEVAMAPGCNAADPDACRLVVTTRFEQPTVWLARSFPYTLRDLEQRLHAWRSHPAVTVFAVGRSPRGRPLYGLRVDAQGAGGAGSPTPPGKKTIWVQARSHPGEVGGSYVLEGLVERILADDELGRSLRAKYRFDIVPMHNPDGVVLGNYRANGESLDLENRWFTPEAGSPLHITLDSPRENVVLNRGFMADAAADLQAPPVLALNLHSRVGRDS